VVANQLVILLLEYLGKGYYQSTGDGKTDKKSSNN